MTIKKCCRGFVALMSVIIISAILLTLIFTLNLASYFARFDALGGENKRSSLGNAEACIEVAKLKIAQNASYAPSSGGDSITVNGANTCKICNVATLGGNSYTITSRSVKNNSYSTVTVTATIASSTFTLTNYTENSSYLGPTCNVP